MRRYWYVWIILLVNQAGVLVAAHMSPEQKEPSEIVVVSGRGPEGKNEVRTLELGNASRHNQRLQIGVSRLEPPVLAALTTKEGQSLLVVGEPKEKTIVSYLYIGDREFEPLSQLRVPIAPYMIAGLKQGSRDYLLIADYFGISLLEWLENRFEVRKKRMNDLETNFRGLHTLQDGDEHYVAVSEGEDNVYTGRLNEERLTIDWKKPNQVTDLKGHCDDLVIAFGHVDNKSYLFGAREDQINVYPLNQGRLVSCCYSRMHIPEFNVGVLATFTRNKELFLVAGGNDLRKGGSKQNVFKVILDKESGFLELIVTSEWVKSALSPIYAMVTFPYYYLQTQNDVKKTLLEEAALPEDIARLIGQMTTEKKAMQTPSGLDLGDNKGRAISFDQAVQAIEQNLSGKEVADILDSGIDINEQDGEGNTLLRIALFKEAPDEIIALLLTKGADTQHLATNYVYAVTQLERKRLQAIQRSLKDDDGSECSIPTT